MEGEIRNFWQSHPCGAELVGDLTDESLQAYLDFFDRYDQYRYSTEPHILGSLNKVDFKGKKVLEIGLGQGADAEQIVKRGGLYSGADLTEESVKRIRMRFSLKGLPFESIDQASALDLPFADSTFDIVFSHGVLHHIPEIERAAAEISRVLKPNGELIVMLYARWSLNYLLAIRVLRRIGLLGLHAANIKPGGIYDEHLKNAAEIGISNYLRINNFISVSTDGPHNPYSKVYDLGRVKQDFKGFNVVSSHKHFMHAPPLKVKWLPLDSILGWHLWVHLRSEK